MWARATGTAVAGPAPGPPGLDRGLLRVAGWGEALAWLAALAAASSFGFGLLAVRSTQQVERSFFEPGFDGDALLRSAAWAGAAGLAAFAVLVVGLAAAIVLAVLWFRILGQANRFGARLGLGPAWAVAGWLIPVANAVLVPLVGANARRTAAWRGTVPMGGSWRTGFPASAAVALLAFVGAVALRVAAASTESGTAGADLVRWTGLAAVSLGFGALAVLARATRTSLAGSPMLRRR